MMLMALMILIIVMRMIIMWMVIMMLWMVRRTAVGDVAGQGQPDVGSGFP